MALALLKKPKVMTDTSFEGRVTLYFDFLIATDASDEHCLAESLART